MKVKSVHFAADTFFRERSPVFTGAKVEKKLIKMGFNDAQIQEIYFDAIDIIWDRHKGKPMSEKVRWQLINKEAYYHGKGTIKNIKRLVAEREQQKSLGPENVPPASPLWQP